MFFFKSRFSKFNFTYIIGERVSASLRLHILIASKRIKEQRRNSKLKVNTIFLLKNSRLSLLAFISLLPLDAVIVCVAMFVAGLKWINLN